MIYYTTKEQEYFINKPYLKAIKEKEKEIKKKEKETGQIQKYTAYFWIKKPSRKFICRDGVLYVLINDKEYPCVNNEVEGGKTYSVDLCYKRKFKEFVKKYPNYLIEFKEIGGGLYYYCSIHEDAQPAKIFDLQDEKNYLLLENEDKYDIGCL